MREWFDYTIAQTGSFRFTVYNVILIVFTLLFAAVLTKYSKKILYKRVALKNKSYAGRFYMLWQLVKYCIYAVTVFIILDILGVNLTMLKAGSAALLVGLGFGLQHTFNDLVSGFIILFEGTLKIGNIVEVQNLVGRVKELGLRTSKIETRDGVTITIPNSKMVMDNVINWSHQEIDKTRFNIRIHIAFETDVKNVKEILLACAAQHKEVENLPPPKVRLYDFSESGYVFDLLFWTSNLFFVETVKSDLRFMILEEFSKNNIQISYPHREIKMTTN